MPHDTTLDFLVSKLRAEPEEEILQRLHRFVYEAVTHPHRVQYETESSVNYRYIENDCYTDEELAELAQRGQPPTKRNEIAPHMEKLAGQFIQTRTAATFVGRHTPADDATAALAQDYVRWIDQQNLYEFEEQTLAWDGLIGGVGWLKQTVRRNELGEWQESIRACNPFHIFPDPYSTRYDPNEDAKYICEGTWMDVEDAIARWPEQEAALRELADGRMLGSSYGGYPAIDHTDPSLRNEAMFTVAHALYVDRDRKRLRPFEVWYKRKVRQYYLLLDDRLVVLPVPLDAKQARTLVAELGDRATATSAYVDRLYNGVFVGDVLIHHDLSPHQTNLFPYTPFYSGRRKNGVPLSLASRLVPINEAINKRESKALALMTNQKIIAERDAILDPQKAQEENAKPDGYVEVESGAISQGRVVFANNLELGQGQLLLLQEDKDAIRRVSGQGNEAMGMPGEVRSGVGIARKQMMSNLIVTPAHNNLRHTRYLKVRLSHAYMKQYLTEEIAFQITDDANQVRTVRATAGQIQALKERTYDLVLTETKDYTVLREQQVEMLLTALPALAPLGPAFVKLGVALTDLREKEMIMQMIDAQSQRPPEQPKLNVSMTWSDLTPEEKAFFALSALQSPELAQVLATKGDDPAFVQKIKADLAKTQIKEGTRASVERGRVNLSAYQTAMDGLLQARALTQKVPPVPPATPGGNV